MINLIHRILDTIPHDVFTDTAVFPLIPGTVHRRYGLMKRTLASGDLIQIRRSLYLMAPRFRREKLNLFAIAQKIYGPSYVSFESALSYHGWIPESVTVVANATLKRSTTFTTPVGVFTYTPIHSKNFMAGVERVCDGSAIFFMAQPLKALADLVLTRKMKWHGKRPLIKSLRIDEDNLNALRASDFDILKDAYKSRRVLKFLSGLKKELKL